MGVKQSSPSEFLKFLQQRCIDSGHVPRYQLDPQLLDRAEKRGYEPSGSVSLNDLKNWHVQTMAKGMPTDLEDPFLFSLVEEAAVDVEKLGSEIGYSIDAQICYGTLPSDEINGMAIKPPQGDGIVVVLNTGLILALQEMADAVASFWAFRDSEMPGAWAFAQDDSEFRARLKLNVGGHLQFVGAVCDLLGLRIRAQSSEPIPDAADKWEAARHRLSLIMWDHSTMFVIAHEYGHVALGHTGNGVIARKIGGVTVDEIKRNWQQEFEADRIGAEIMVMHTLRTKHTFAMSTIGVEFFLLSVDLVQKLLGDIFSSTHPPPKRRLQRIRKGFSKHYPDISKSSELTGSRLEWLFTELLERNTVHIHNAIEAYIRDKRIGTKGTKD